MSPFNLFILTCSLIMCHATYNLCQHVKMNDEYVDMKENKSHVTNKMHSSIHVIKLHVDINKLHVDTYIAG
jgi:hypothetical protein